ncbi:MAG: SH3 domain-containing protein [Gammaproteobacteria bacterium]
MNIPRISAIFLLPLLPVMVTAAEGDELQVTSHLVNVREGPSVETAVLLKLAEGRSVMEIRREGNWVKVETGNEETPRGWIYANLLQKAAPQAEPGDGEEQEGVQALFELFEQALAEYNVRKKQEAGYAYFTDPEYVGNGVVEVTASRYWLRLPMEQRMKDLSDIFDIWAAAVGEGPSITVNVMARNGEKQMTMFR